MKRTILFFLVMLVSVETHASNKVAEFLQNKTFLGFDHTTNLRFKRYFTDYKLVYSTFNKIGKWYVSDNKICIRWNKDRVSNCYVVKANGNGLQFYNEINNEQKLHFTLTNPRSGNHFNKHSELVTPDATHQNHDDKKKLTQDQNYTSPHNQSAQANTNLGPDAFFSVRYANVTWRKNEFIFLGNRVAFDENDHSALNGQIGFPIPGTNLTIGAKFFIQTWDVKSDSSAPSNAHLGSARIQSATFIVRNHIYANDGTNIFVEAGLGQTQFRLKSREGYTDVALNGLNYQFSTTITLMDSPYHRLSISLTQKTVDLDDVAGNEFKNTANIFQFGYSFYF